MERQPEPTAHREPKPAVTKEPSQEKVTALRIALEPEPHRLSDQVREPATMHATVDETVETEGAEESPSYCSTTDGELGQDSGFNRLFSVIPSLSSYSEISAHPVTANNAIYKLPVYPEVTMEVWFKLTFLNTIASAVSCQLLSSPSAHYQ